ncbi:MAG TPA: peptidyl-prolyl cis-trans isomerase [Candidatus Omnitrophota bacterium]|nr:peptidyl-prolyl cis-trans isomerase [Candidatus Omnitrophota bacterium]HPD84616.1 peptidyl-prolyl cis-trans isomerase [Candidatus Omnitrophota bacterium]HRZ03474.1 peptidyl-prolyl cis-trans isomerase [Candidatus Omnitrophota bacterium]
MKFLITKANFLIYGCIFFLAVSGCDKIPFLSKYFPSAASKKSQNPPAAVAQPQTQSALPAGALAKVGSWTLTKEEFAKELEAIKEAVPGLDTDNLEFKKQVLEQLVRQELLVQEAERTGLARDKEIMDDVDKFRRALLVQKIVANITDGVDVTPAEIQDFYDKNKDVIPELSEPAEWRIREIMVPTQAEAKDILIELLKGTDFAVMAQTRSKSASAAQGGDLGAVEEFKFPEMQTAALSLEIGAISSVFKGPDGYYIIKVEEKKGGKLKTLEEVKDDIKTGLLLSKQEQKVLELLNELKEKTLPETNEELLKE